MVTVLAGVFVYMRYFHLPELPLEESPVDYRILICRYSHRANLPEVFVHTVVLAESSGRSWVVSNVGAKGLMQIMPNAETDTMKKLKLTERGNLFDPDYNLLIGTTYLRILADQFGGDAYLVLGAYHMGRTRVSLLLDANQGISGKDLVERFAGPKTRAYCDKILQGKELRLPMTQRTSRPVTTSPIQHN